LRDDVVKNNSFHDAGIVHQHIDLAVPVANGLHECQHIWPHRYVTLNYLDLRVFRLECALRDHRQNLWLRPGADARNKAEM
jgi:hypothetical protein